MKPVRSLSQQRHLTNLKKTLQNLLNCILRDVLLMATLFHNILLTEIMNLIFRLTQQLYSVMQKHILQWLHSAEHAA